MNKTVKKRVNLINSSETKDYLPHAKLYPLYTNLVQFHDPVFGVFGSFTVFTIFFFWGGISNFFGLSTTDEI
jgi:hypothetical protein